MQAKNVAATISQMVGEDTKIVTIAAYQPFPAPVPWAPILTDRHGEGQVPSCAVGCAGGKKLRV